MAKGRKSRKGKKAWRKNVDIQEEEDNARLRTASDKELFIVDAPTKQPVLSKGERKSMIANRPLFSDKLITPIGKGKSHGIIPRKTETNKYIQRMVTKLEKTKESPVVEEDPVDLAPPAPFFDIWGSSPVAINPNASKQFVKTRKTLLDNPLTRVDPGQSYKPRKEDHQKLLNKALSQVEEKLDPEARAAARIAPTVPRRPDIEVKWNFSDDEDESEEEAITDEAQAQLQKIGKHYSMKFTRTQRNKMKRKKLHEVQRKRHSNTKNRGMTADQFQPRLDALLESIEEKEMLEAEELKKRNQTKEYLRTKTKKVGKLRYSDKPVDFLYSDEIPSSFRKLKPTSTLALDIFNSLEKRNMVATRKPQLQRYRTVKFQETRQAKNFNLLHGL